MAASPEAVVVVPIAIAAGAEAAASPPTASAPAAEATASVPTAIASVADALAPPSVIDPAGGSATVAAVHSAAPAVSVTVSVRDESA